MTELRRTARVRILQDDILRMLDLPMEASVRTVYTTADPPGIVILVESPELDEVREDTESPALGVEYLDGERKRWIVPGIEPVTVHLGEQTLFEAAGEQDPINA